MVLFFKRVQIGGSVLTAGDEALTQDAFVTSGSILKSGTILGAGIVIQQDFTNAAGTISFTKGQVLGAAHIQQMLI